MDRARSLGQDRDGGTGARRDDACACACVERTDDDHHNDHNDHALERRYADATASSAADARRDVRAVCH